MELLRRWVEVERLCTSATAAGGSLLPLWKAGGHHRLNARRNSPFGAAIAASNKAKPLAVVLWAIRTTKNNCFDE